MNLTLSYNRYITKSYRPAIKKANRIWNFFGMEAAIWILGLLYLALINSPESTHFTICPFKNLGIEFCPGCGLGNSVSYLFKGDLITSYHTHPLGILALIIITFRIISIIKFNRRRYA